MGRKKLTAGRDPNLPFICYICGDTARGNNFSVLSCVSCKSFFRRHGLLNVEKLRCKHQNNCPINKETRGNCLPCRLKKCLELGMDPQMIRCPPASSSYHKGERTNKQQQQQQNHNPRNQQQQKQQQQKPLVLSNPRRLDLLDYGSRLTLTTEQWTLLSNVINCYDGQNMIGRVRFLIDEKSALPVKLRSKAADTLNLISEPIKSLVPFIRMSTHFHHLSVDAQHLLLSNNLFYTGAMNGHFIGREVGAFRNPTYMTACSALYGEDYMMKCAKDNLKLEPNGNLLKLMVFVLIFSSNCSIVLHSPIQLHQSVVQHKTLKATTLELLKMQDIYVTLLWQYMVYLYGYDQAAIRFAGIIKSVMDMFSRVEELPMNPTDGQTLNACSRESDGSSMCA